MERCERCGEVMPAVSKVCPFCGHINSSNSGASLDDSIEKLESYILAAKKASLTPFTGYLKKYAWLFYIVLSIQFFVLAAVSLNYFIWLLVILFLCLFVISLIRLLRKNNRQSNLNSIISEYTSCRNNIEKYYGESKYVKKQILQTDEELHNISRKQKTNNLKYNLLSLSCIIFILCISGTVIFSLSKDIARNDVSEDTITLYLNEKKYEQAIQAYPTVASKTIDEGASVKVQIISQLTTASEYSLAVSFFHNYCIGKPDDFKYAEIIVRQMLKSGHTDEAYTFIEECTDLYYKSDYERLIKLITK